MSLQDLSSGDQGPEAGAVHERQPAQVHGDIADLADRADARGLRARIHVELPVEEDHEAVIFGRDVR